MVSIGWRIEIGVMHVDDAIFAEHIARIHDAVGVQNWPDRSNLSPSNSMSTLP